MQRGHRCTDQLLLTRRLRRLFARVNERQPLLHHHQGDESLSWFHAASRPLEALHHLRSPQTNPSKLAWAPASFAAEADGAPPQTKPEDRLRERAPPHLAAPPGDPPPSAHPAAPQLSFLMNASFLHETCLFLLLLRHPLPSSSLSRLSSLSEREPLQVHGHGTVAEETTHYILQNGLWRSCLPCSVEATWLRAATPAVDVQLELGASTDPTAGDDQAPNDSLGERGDAREPALARLCSHDYLEHLIWPTQAAGAVRPDLTADCVWVDASSVRARALHSYNDAFWAPFSTSHSFAAWHRASLCATLDNQRAAASLEALRWTGDLYICG
ncbi:conserved hypothetical protein [Leishmania major strain Friedlin]|uniref:Uncharacterized protein n=1 Tax=Leishmania major TaxID=5664 RepID=Q4Q796_LEIMA|nr:conserved hypothetical protein [Leishmania major strain Friedlin]CAG9578431.1 hypothetical_protein_-_conserved [Leishmania major strain Friedlin]CAJ06381.1 conserved hypothetical protein [Leishmania major strain Friedlin]|eukprot:XP_001684802.1 conserved hypothetical protein [Leishmania major strain Friedlin]